MFFNVKNSKIIKTIKELAYQLPVDNLEWVGLPLLVKKNRKELLEILMTTCLLADADILKNIKLKWATNKTLYQWYNEQMTLVGSSIEPEYWSKPIFPII